MKELILVLSIACSMAAGNLRAQEVVITFDRDSPQAAYAARKLGKVLNEEGYQVVPDQAGCDYSVSLALDPSRLQKEAFSILPDGSFISVYGGDDRGLIYGAMALTESIRNGTALDKVKDLLPGIIDKADAQGLSHPDSAVIGS